MINILKRIYFFSTKNYLRAKLNIKLHAFYHVLSYILCTNGTFDDGKLVNLEHVNILQNF